MSVLIDQVKVDYCEQVLDKLILLLIRFLEIAPPAVYHVQSEGAVGG